MPRSWWGWNAGSGCGGGDGGHVLVTLRSLGVSAGGGEGGVEHGGGGGGTGRRGDGGMR